MQSGLELGFEGRVACARAIAPRLFSAQPHRARHQHVSQSHSGCRDSRKERAKLALIHAAASTAGVEMETEAGIEKAVTILKQAASTGAVPAAAVCQAFVELEEKKLADESYGEAVGGGRGGKRWRLSFLSRPNHIQNVKKGNKGGGYYVPVPAMQSYIKEDSKIRNGIFLGQIAAIEFQGPYEYNKNKLSFDFNLIRLRLGPKWFDFKIKSMKKETDKAGPFFLMIYVDDEIIAARGRGGGIGLWQRTSPEWELKSGSAL